MAPRALVCGARPCQPRRPTPSAPLPAGRGAPAALVPAAAAPRLAPPLPAATFAHLACPALAALLPLLLRELRVGVPFVGQDRNVVVGPWHLQRSIPLLLLLLPAASGAAQPRRKLPAALRQPDAVGGGQGGVGGQLPPRALGRAAWCALRLWRRLLCSAGRALHRITRLWLLLLLLFLPATAAWRGPCRTRPLQPAPLGSRGGRSSCCLRTRWQLILTL